MTELLTAAQMRAIEAAAIASGEVTGLELMERAGHGVVEAVLEEWPEMALTSHRAVVLCGPGNNGGDGFVVARLLKERGWEVEVFLYGDAGKLPPDARVNYERWGEMGEFKAGANLENRKEWGCDLLVDALFGTGLSRPLAGFGTLLWEVSDMRNSFQPVPGHEKGQPAIVAIDIPSGICADSGRTFDHGEPQNPPAIAAHLTVTFHDKKLGHYLADGPFHCRHTVKCDIGLNSNQDSCLELATVSLFHLKKQTRSHKYAHGHALICSGPVSQTGASRLAARGALRVGAGLVTIAAPSDACREHAAQLNAIMLREADTPDALSDLLGDARINAVCLGPGLGVERAQGFVEAAVGAEHAPCVVLDADALTAFAGEPEALFSMLNEGCVMTPHGGEFGRLFPDIAAKLAEPATKGPAYSKVDATREAAARAGCVVLYKGADTVIAGPDGRCAVNSAHYERAAPWLATAGSGDVLAGFITGLMARGFAPMSAAETGAWLHVECARKFGPGLIAEDLPEMLPGVFRDLGL